MKLYWVVLVVGLVTLNAGSLAAQDEPPPDESQSRSSTTPSQAAEPREFQMTGDVGSRLAFGHMAEAPGLHVNNNIFSLLEYKPIRNAIQMTDTQTAELAKAQIEQIKLRQGMMRSLEGTNEPRQIDPQAAARRQAAMTDLEAKSRALYREILLPQQIQRLEEIAFELRIQSQGIVAFLKDPQMVAELEITDQQQAALEKRAIAASQDFDAKVMELKRQFRLELVSELNEDQRLRLESMLGPTFDWMRARSTDPDDD